MKQEQMAKYSSGYKTRLAIVDATTHLVRGQSLDKLSVEKICEEAGVCRATFYYHFVDKFDVAQWHFDQVTSEFLNQIGRTLTWRQGFERNTLRVLTHKELYLAAFSLRGYQSLFSYAKRARRDALRETIEEFHHVELDEELEFQVYAWVETEIGVISHWFKTGMKLETIKMCGYLEDIVPRRLHGLLNEPVDPAPF